jgi:hypothetical protein
MTLLRRHDRLLRRARLRGLRLKRPLQRRLGRPRLWLGRRRLCRRGRLRRLALRRSGGRGRLFRARPARGLALDPADRFLQRQPLACDLGLPQRRGHAAQLRNEGRPRPFIKSASGLTGIPVQPSYGTRD